MGFPPRCPDPPSKVCRRREQTAHRKSLIFVFHPYSPSPLPSQHFHFDLRCEFLHIVHPRDTHHNISTLRPSQPLLLSIAHTTHYTMISRSALCSLDSIFHSNLNLPGWLACGLVQPRGFHVMFTIAPSHLRRSYLVHDLIIPHCSLLSDPILPCCLLFCSGSFLARVVRFYFISRALCCPFSSLFLIQKTMCSNL